MMTKALAVGGTFAVAYNALSKKYALATSKTYGLDRPFGGRRPIRA